ncbi:DUF4238 domain-containing protein [Gordonia soli]|uniref:DUF4238 domain-containing protein n=1 Tax=Gordonia soli NBRC 108243 TaxID=1223545 RepID=M0QKT7_9ACTN|nr:DUF4238 domain-containing protein [Gordonia soli]GAC68871.1 hypothetical protein GS4_19_00610 [Gordonia soli NBRC 108243]
MGQTAKLHHTVPKFYLRGFADERERIVTIRLPDKKLPPQSIDKTAATNHFYSVAGHPDGTDAFEKALNRLETPTADALRSLADGDWPLDEEKRTLVSYFLAMQAVRGPDQRRNIGHMGTQMIKLEAQFTKAEGAQAWAKRRLGVDVDAEEAARLLDRAARPTQPLKVPPEVHLQNMASLSAKLTPYIVGRPWTLVRFERRSLLTCDSPVGLVRQPEDNQPWQGVGFLTAWGITFPVTRKIGLVMSNIDPLAEAGIPVERVWAGEFDREERGTTAYEKFINESTIDSASECVYLHPDDERFLPNDLPEPRPISMYGPGQEYVGD